MPEVKTMALPFETEISSRETLDPNQNFELCVLIFWCLVSSELGWVHANPISHQSEMCNKTMTWIMWYEIFVFSPVNFAQMYLNFIFKGFFAKLICHEFWNNILIFCVQLSKEIYPLLDKCYSIGNIMR